MTLQGCYSIPCPYSEGSEGPVYIAKCTPMVCLAAWKLLLLGYYKSRAGGPRWHVCPETLLKNIEKPVAKGEWPKETWSEDISLEGQCIGGSVSKNISLWWQPKKQPGFCDTYCDRNDTCSNNGECNESKSQQPQKPKCLLRASVSIVWRFFFRKNEKFLKQGSFGPTIKKYNFGGLTFWKKRKIKWCGSG